MTDHLTADVTVVIATFNRAKFLPEAIESMLNQHVRPVRIVVVDDGSTDQTQQLVERYAKDVEYVLKENGGKAKALNSVLPSITTKYLWFFDDDDAAYPDALQRLVEFLDNKNDLGFVFGSFDVAKSNTTLLQSSIRPVPYLYSGGNVVQQRLRLYRDCTVMMSGSIIRTKAVIAVGGLNEDLIRCQDYDLMVRLAAKYDFAYCGSSVYVWREHDGLRGSLESRHADEGRVRVWAKYNEPIGRYLRYELSLRSFSIEPACIVDTQRGIRESLISRSWVLAPKLPLYPVVNDLIEAFELERSLPLNAKELVMLEETFHHDFVSYKEVNSLMRLWRLALTPPGCVALEHLSKGIYWLGRRERRVRDKFRFTSVAIWLFVISRASKLILVRNVS